jgi:hypothetical protein
VFCLHEAELLQLCQPPWRSELLKIAQLPRYIGIDSSLSTSSSTPAAHSGHVRVSSPPFAVIVDLEGEVKERVQSHTSAVHAHVDMSPRSFLDFAAPASLSESSSS